MDRIVLSVTLTLALTTSAQAATRVYTDQPFMQDFSEKVPLASEVSQARLWKVRTNRNGRVLVLSDKGLLQVQTGMLRPDHQYRSLTDTRIRDMDTHQGQFVYLTDEEVLSHAWAGTSLVEHHVPDARRLAMGDDFDFMALTERQAICLRAREPAQSWEIDGGKVRQVIFDDAHKRYLLLTDKGLWCLVPGKTEPTLVLAREDLRCLAFSNDGNALLAGTSNGYLRLEPNSLEKQANVVTRLPCAELACIGAIGERVWFGTPKGAFALHSDGRIDYYASKRWLVDDTVVDIQPGPEQSVLVLSEGGLSIIHFRSMTLADKAGQFDKLTRQRHIRYGFNSAFAMSLPGDLSSGTLIDSDNDGLWTAMYLAGELFRYAVTKSDQALCNCYESFEAMERLTSITGIAGFPARSFERAGYEVADKSRWHAAADGRWRWKGTTSSDEIVGHFFAYALFAEIAPDEARRQRAIALMDAIMDHIVRHNWYLVDYDGKPTQWGRWHPEYVNRFPRRVGDRRLNSAEIIAFLQTAYHFTGKELYRQKAFELLDQHGYLDNIMIPINEVSHVPGIDLATEWNHSDDELAFLSYWNLCRYAFTPELREKYRQAIRDHWEIERPEKNPLWNFIYAATGAQDFDLPESIGTLREFPLDTISWAVRNSTREDLEFLEPNFREQTTKAVLPPDERPMSKHNGSAFRLDGGDGGREEFSGDIYLLPYWMGRWLSVIR